MAINASIITDTAKSATKRAVVDYGAGVFAHTTQDWLRHNCVNINADLPFTAASETVASQSLRILATLDDGSALGLDIALLLPLNPAGTSAVTNSAPIIIQQPSNKVVPPYATVQLQVAAISDIVVTYQWFKENTEAAFVAIGGKTASTLVIPDVETTDAGNYRVTVTNANGSVTSSTATVTVNAGASGSNENDAWYEQLPGVRVTRAFFGLF